MSEARHPEPDRLSAYLDGDVTGDEGRRIRVHLEECDRCLGVLDELKEIVRRAGSLQDRDPERDLWPAVSRAIESDAETGTATGRERVGTRRRPFQMTLPQAAAAAVVLISLSAGAAWLAHPDGSVQPPATVRTPEVQGARTAASVEPAPEGYAEELAELEESLRRSRDQLDPNTVRVLEKNLAVIDRAIRESRQALEVDPGNSFLEEHLERTYRTKLEYLRQVRQVSEWSS